mgnify:CR=1 FL=1
MLDQAIFTITDTAMGIAADRIARVRRQARRVRRRPDRDLLRGLRRAAVRGGHRAGRAGLVHRADPDLGRHVIGAARAAADVARQAYAARPAIPFLSALAMLGYGLAGAVSPYLGVVLRNHDPRLPFVISGVVLLVTTLALSKVERGLAQDPPVAKAPAAPAKPLGQVPMFFIASMVILSLGYQLHFAINSTPFFLRFAKPDELPWLMPVFWIGFNIAMFPASVVVKHRGGLIVMGAAGLLGALAVLGAEIGRQSQHADRRAVHRRRGAGAAC